MRARRNRDGPPTGMTPEARAILRPNRSRARMSANFASRGPTARAHWNRFQCARAVGPREAKFADILARDLFGRRIARASGVMPVGGPSRFRLARIYRSWQR